MSEQKLPCVLISKSTQTVLNPNAVYPRSSMSEPVEGLDPDLEYLIKYTPFAEPDYDSRIFILNETQEITQEPHPVYPNLNVYKKTFTTSKRTNSEITDQIKNAQKLADAALYGTEDQLAFMFRVQSAMSRKIENLQLTTDEQNVLDRHAVINVKIAQNQDNYTNLVAFLLGGGTPQIDEGWQNTI